MRPGKVMAKAFKALVYSASHTWLGVVGWGRGIGSPGKDISAASCVGEWPRVTSHP